MSVRNFPLKKLGLPRVVKVDHLNLARDALVRSQLDLHQLELSHKILSYPSSSTGKNKENQRNHIFKLLLPHIHLQEVSITTLNNELLSESIVKKILFCKDHNDQNLDVNKDVDEDAREFTFQWRCERHNNPHLDINSFSAKLVSQNIKSLVNDDQNEVLFHVNEMENDVSQELINSHMNWFMNFTSDCLQWTPEGQQCQNSITRRDLSWFLSFLLTHPSDEAFDVVSEYLMKEN